MSSIKAPTIRLTGISGGVLASLQRAFNDIDHINFLIGQYHPQVDAVFDEEAVFYVARNGLQNAVVFVDNDVLRKPAVSVRTLVQTSTEEKVVMEPLHQVAQVPPEMRRIPSPLIQRIMYQITSKALDTEDADALQHSAFKLVFKYSWLRKTLAVLAAFTLHYGDYWYWVRSIPSDPQAQQISALEGSRAMKARIEADVKIKNAFVLLNELVKELLELIEIIFELTVLCANNPEREVPVLNLVFNRLPEWNCQAVVAILAVNAQFTKFINAEEERWPEWELTQLPVEVAALKKELRGELDHCNLEIELNVSYKKYVKSIENPSSVADVIKELLQPGVDSLLYGVTSKLMKIDSIRGKDVLIVISTLKIGADDLDALAEVYKHFERFPKLADQQTDLFPIFPGGQEAAKNFEMIWFPFIQDFHDPQSPFYVSSIARREDTLYVQEQLPKFRMLQAKMPWLTVEDPSQLHPYARRFFKEEWFFKGDTIVVALNQNGRVECINAMPRIRIWGSKAFPYELTLNMWKTTPYWIQAMFDRNPEMFAPGRYTFIYGGENFPSKLSEETTSKIERATGINIVHVADPRIFKRLENTLLCRMQYLLERSPNEHQPSDSVFDQLSEAYTAYEKGGLAILTRGPEVLFIGPAEPALKDLLDYERWYNKDVEVVSVFRQKPPTSTKSVFLPSTGWWNPDWMKCKQTGQNMKYIENYKCCDD